MSTATDQIVRRSGIAAPEVECVTITPGREPIARAVRDLWHFRELLYFLAWRDIKVRYKQTVLGVAWAVLQPLVIAGTLAIFLGRFVNTAPGGIPYIVFVYVAMLPWQLFSNILTESSHSLVANERLVTKAYCPRLLVPASTVVGGLVDFACGLVVMVPFLAYYRIVPGVTIFALPWFVLLACVAATGAGLWLAALNVEYRDVRYTLGFLVQAWFFLSPIAYSSNVVPVRWRVWYGLNPVAGAVEAFRWALLPAYGPAPVKLILTSGAAAAVLLVSGVLYFRRMEATFADVI